MAARRSYQFGKYNHNIITAMVVAAASLTRGSAIAAVAVSFSRWLCRGRGSGQAMAARETHSVPRFCQRPAFLNEKNLCAELDCSGCIQVAARETHTAAAKAAAASAAAATHRSPGGGAAGQMPL